jgi:hypothetical protein
LNIGNLRRFQIKKAANYLLYTMFCISMFLLQDNHDRSRYMIYYGLGALIFIRNLKKINILRFIGPTFLLYFSFVIYATCGLFWGPSIQISSYKLFIFGAAMFFSFYIELSSKEDCERITYVVYTSSVILSCYFIINMSLNNESGRTTVEGLNVINAGVVAAIGSVTSFYLAKLKHNKIYFIALVPTYLTALMSSSKLALFSSFAMPFLFFYFCNGQTMKRVKIIIVGLLGLVLVLIAIFRVDILYDTVGYRIESLLQVLFQGKEGDDTLRIIMVQKGIQLFRRSPLLGVGFDCYRLLNGWTNTWSHCNYIEILSCLGSIGFILYYLRYVVLLWEISRSKLGNSVNAAYAKALIISIIILEAGIVTMHAALYQFLFALAYRLGTTSSYVEGNKINENTSSHI